jgi:nitroreductase
VGNYITSLINYKTVQQTVRIFQKRTQLWAKYRYTDTIELGGRNMAETLEPKLLPIFSRRSIRTYSDKPIPDGVIKELLNAAMAAPSAVGKDPWRFIVIKQKETLLTVAEALPNGKMLGDAGAGIIVLGDLEATHREEIGYLLQDCSAAIENLLIAASILGLGACWLGVYPVEDRITHLKKVFSLPDTIVPVSAIALGYPEEEKPPRTRFEKSYVHHEKW